MPRNIRARVGGAGNRSGGLFAPLGEALPADRFPEDTLAPELVMPDQFHEVWRAVKTLTPERELAASVVWQAALDLATCRNSASRKKRQLYWKAYHWVVSNDRAWPYSFLNLCDTLGLSIGVLRRELLKGGWPGRIDAVSSAA